MSEGFAEYQGVIRLHFESETAQVELISPGLVAGTRDLHARAGVAGVGGRAHPLSRHSLASRNAAPYGLADNARHVIGCHLLQAFQGTMMMWQVQVRILPFPHNGNVRDQILLYNVPGPTAANKVPKGY